MNLNLNLHRLTERGLGVLRLDALSPVLAEEHEGRHGTLGTGLVLGGAFGLGARLFSGFALGLEWEGVG